MNAPGVGLHGLQSGAIASSLLDQAWNRESAQSIIFSGSPLEHENLGQERIWNAFAINGDGRSLEEGVSWCGWELPRDK